MPATNKFEISENGNLAVSGTFVFFFFFIKPTTKHSYTK